MMSKLGIAWTSLLGGAIYSSIVWCAATYQLASCVIAASIFGIILTICLVISFLSAFSGKKSSSLVIAWISFLGGVGYSSMVWGATAFSLEPCGVG